MIIIKFDFSIFFSILCTVLPLITVPNPMVTANESSTVLLECNAVGTPPPTISWFKDSVPLPSSSLPRTTIAANNSLIVTGVLLIDAGVYVCQASNTGGTESATVTLHVNSKCCDSSVMIIIAATFYFGTFSFLSSISSHHSITSYNHC